MKPLYCASVLAVGSWLLAAAIGAQAAPERPRHTGAQASQSQKACGALDLWALRGTYTFTATAWQDLSVINPALPKGYAPVTIIGSFQINGSGELTGWASVNAGGLAMNSEFVNSQVGAPRPDCGFPLTLSMKINEFGEGVVGPYSYVGVAAGDGAALTIDFMMLGAGPGSHVELDHAKRISMHFE